MNMDMLGRFISGFNAIAWGWPLIIFVLLVGAAATVMLGFVQFRYFFTAWRLLFSPGKRSQQALKCRLCKHLLTP